MLAPPTINNCINKRPRLCKEQIIYLLRPLVQDHILSFFLYANRVEPEEADLIRTA